MTLSTIIRNVTILLTYIRIIMTLSTDFKKKGLISKLSNIMVLQQYQQTFRKVTAL